MTQDAGDLFDFPALSESAQFAWIHALPRPSGGDSGRLALIPSVDFDGSTLFVVFRSSAARDPLTGATIIRRMNNGELTRNVADLVDLLRAQIRENTDWIEIPQTLAGTALLALARCPGALFSEDASLSAAAEVTLQYSWEARGDTMHIADQTLGDGRRHPLIE